MLVFTSKCPLEVQISQGLGPLLQIELLKTGRMPVVFSRATPAARRSLDALRWARNPGTCVPELPQRCAAPAPRRREALGHLEPRGHLEPHVPVRPRRPTRGGAHASASAPPQRADTLGSEEPQEARGPQASSPKISDQWPPLWLSRQTPTWHSPQPRGSPGRHTDSRWIR